MQTQLIRLFAILEATPIYNTKDNRGSNKTFQAFNRTFHLPVFICCLRRAEINSS